MIERGSILTLNAGSSSVKFALFDRAANLRETVRGEIENLSGAPHFHAHDGAGKVIAEKRWPAGSTPAFPEVLAELLTFTEAHLGADGLTAVGHRIVHGGADHIGPARITPALLAELEALTPLDPLHMPLNLAPIHALLEARPALPQVACFDTAFHHTLPAVAQRFALPQEISAKGVRRYGFHGLSFEYIASCLHHQAPALSRGRVIVAHLGAGASLCALRDGRSIATTTGFSALDGLMMGTRCGLLDPGVLLYLLRQGHDVDDLEDMLYRRSGLLGVSGISGDVRVLLASDAPAAREALDLFTYRIAWEAGALVSALGGLDGMVFTAGIGEHAPRIRAEVCARLSWLGLRLDAQANLTNERCISLPDSAIDLRVIATNEEAMIARHSETIIDRVAA
ncbi:acetate/propionate family kinase [Acidisoma sp.]|uniref:acetate/propionate family kinase n=1 Tax=Acidisoma sp. TaxID=1872115 RepID=UPI003AFFB8B4